jgi:hypothetical protein
MVYQPFTTDDFWRRVEDKRVVSQAVVGHRTACREAWHAAGTAIEFALKAVIMKRQCLNDWPSRDSRPDLWTHDIKKLLTAAGINPKDAPPPPRSSLRTVMDWDRGHDYASERMSRATARSMVDSAFGDGEVVAWLKTL